MRTGVRLGLDPGEARIGVARSDPSGVLATPVETVLAERRARMKDNGIMVVLGFGG